jgi:gliding motility-associated-like protein
MQTRFACWGETDGEASVSANGGNGGPFDFLWSNGQTGGGASNLSTGLYTVTATDTKGCTGTQIVAIQQLDSIEVLIAYAPPTCANYTDGIVGVVQIEGGLGMDDSTQYYYWWSLPAAPNATLVSGFSAGHYGLTVSDFQGCSQSIGFDVLGPPPLILQLAIEHVSCFDFSDGAVAVSEVQNAVGGVSFAWNNLETGSRTDSLLAGIYQVSTTDANGCTASATAEVVQPEALVLELQVTPLICASDSNAQIAASVFGGTGSYDFQWDNGETTSEISQLFPGLYTLQVWDQNGCSITDSANVAQPNALSFSVEITEPDCFGGNDARIRANVSGGAIPYRYSLNDGLFGGSSVFIALGAGGYKLQVRDGNGCVATDSIFVGQPPPVQVFVSIDTSIVLGDSLLLSPTVNNSVGLVQFEWSGVLLDSFSCADLPECGEIWVSPGFTNTYRLKVTDENGCMGFDEITVSVQKPRGVYVPTGFTPNGDFENDLLVVHGKGRQVRKILVFKVFDRWGELLYEDRDFPVNDTARGWDGTFRNQPCDPGVYVWLLEAEYLDGQIEFQKGDVTLIR